MRRFLTLLAYELIKSALLIVVVLVIFAAMLTASDFTGTSIWLWLAALLVASIVINAWAGWRKGQ